MKNWRDYIFIAAIGGVIGAIISGTVLIIVIRNISRIYLLYRSIIYISVIFGIIIAPVYSFLFEYFYKKVKENALLTFSVYFLINGASTFILSYILGTRDLFTFIIAIGMAEICGNAFALLMINYYKKLNRKLKETQETFKD